MRNFKWIGLPALAVLFLVIGIVLAVQQSGEEEDPDGMLTHIHGLGYSSDGKQVWVPAHDGIRVFEGGEWSVPNGDKHDYMGFVVVDNGFYSSGHPAPDSDMSNPMGIVKTSGIEDPLQTLGLSGVSDFHLMSIGYTTHTIYVMNEGPNNKMPSAGLYYSDDDAVSWSEGELDGLQGEASAIAAHPTKPGVVAIGTNLGVFVSRDYGQSFESMLPGLQVTALHFSPDGQLYVGGINAANVLIKFDVDARTETMIRTPEIPADDAISYIAQNPADGNEVVVTTFSKMIYLTKDGGGKWSTIADQGNTSNEA
ncbi:F510_1955 family glycosylhydrolase [Paenibacillus spongiae]|uniref:Glycosyl hydrolase n=1 Tax=Paenibacillus spongiae TaxID=2909671 RepID=A0ABY5SFW0_9BACL|nr:glycosyl hydrolase [Paenibacillus spongiae]UVI31153.1 glycosyl hydrolase [Paenibacillus spongiae]